MLAFLNPHLCPSRWQPQPLLREYPGMHERKLLGSSACHGLFSQMLLCQSLRFWRLSAVSSRAIDEERRPHYFPPAAGSVSPEIRGICSISKRKGFWALHPPMQLWSTEKGGLGGNVEPCSISQISAIEYLEVGF